MTLGQREHLRRLRLKLAAKKRHRMARDPYTGKSRLAVEAGKKSGLKREGDSVWGLEMSLKRWHGKEGYESIVLQAMLILTPREVRGRTRGQILPVSPYVEDVSHG